MYLSATSTDFLLLSQKVESLTHTLDWTVGSLSIVLTILFAVFLSFQFLSAQREIRVQVEAAKEEMRKLIEQQKDKFSQELERMKSVEEANTGRSWAQTFRVEGNFEGAAWWWIYAAFWYYSGNLAERTKQAKEYLKESLKDLGKLKDKPLWGVEMKEMCEGSLKILEKECSQEVAEIRKYL